MKDLIKLEYKKLWNGISIVSLVALSILTIIFAVVTLNIQHRTIDKDGNIVTGLPSFRALKEAAEDLEGVMDGDYIQNLIEDYNSSFDKAYMDEHRGFLGTGGVTKYIITNYVINYAYYGPYMSNGNDKIGLDYEFLNSEESFYQKTYLQNQILLISLRRISRKRLITVSLMAYTFLPLHQISL